MSDSAIQVIPGGNQSAACQLDVVHVFVDIQQNTQVPGTSGPFRLTASGSGASVSLGIDERRLETGFVHEDLCARPAAQCVGGQSLSKALGTRTR